MKGAVAIEIFDSCIKCYTSKNNAFQRKIFQEESVCWHQNLTLSYMDNQKIMYFKTGC